MKTKIENMRVNDRAYSIRYGWGDVMEVNKPNVRLRFKTSKDQNFNPDDLMTKSEAIKAGHKDSNDS